LGRIGFEQSETSKMVLQVEVSRDLFILKQLHRGGSNKPLEYNRFHNVTFGTEITTRPGRRCGVDAGWGDRADRKRND